MNMLLLLLACAGDADAPTATDTAPTGDTAVDGERIAVRWTGSAGTAALVLADTTGEITLLGAVADEQDVVDGEAVLRIADPEQDAVEDADGNLLATWMLGVSDDEMPLGAWPGYLAWSWLDGVDQPAWYLVYLDETGVNIDAFDPGSQVVELTPNLVADTPTPLTGTTASEEVGLSVDLFHLPTLTEESPVEDPVLATTEVDEGAFSFDTLPDPPASHPVAELAGEATTGILVSAYVGVLYEDLDGTAGVGDDDRLVASTVTDDGTTLLLHLEPTDLRAVLYPSAYGLVMGWSLFSVVGDEGTPQPWSSGLHFTAP